MSQYTNYEDHRRRIEEGAESFFNEIIVENISNLGREIDM